MTSNLFFDFKTVRELFKDYASHCEPWEVSFTHNGMSKPPHQWLKELDDSILNARFCEMSSGSGVTSVTAEIKGWFKRQRFTFSVQWHPERHGWSENPNVNMNLKSASKVAHYYVPLTWVSDPPGHLRNGELISLCKRMDIQNDMPLYPLDPNLPVCKVCMKAHEKINAGNG